MVPAVTSRGSLPGEVPMRKIIFSITFFLAVACAGAYGQEQEKKSEAGAAAWLKGLRQKISQIVPKKSIVMSTGVAGVRGAKEDDQAKLYWKGKKTEEPISEEELQEFKEALDLIEKGDQAAAVRELEELLNRFPDSALVPDAKKTLDLVKAEAKVQKESEPEEKK